MSSAGADRGAVDPGDGEGERPEERAAAGPVRLQQGRRRPGQRRHGPQHHEVADGHPGDEEGPEGVDARRAQGQHHGARRPIEHRAGEAEHADERQGQADEHHELADVVAAEQGREPRDEGPHGDPSGQLRSQSPDAGREGRVGDQDQVEVQQGSRGQPRADDERADQGAEPPHGQWRPGRCGTGGRNVSGRGRPCALAGHRIHGSGGSCAGGAREGSRHLGRGPPDAHRRCQTSETSRTGIALLT